MSIDSNEHDKIESTRKPDYAEFSAADERVYVFDEHGKVVDWFEESDLTDFCLEYSLKGYNRRIKAK